MQLNSIAGPQTLRDADLSRFTFTSAAISATDQSAFQGCLYASTIYILLQSVGPSLDPSIPFVCSSMHTLPGYTVRLALRLRDSISLLANLHAVCRYSRSTDYNNDRHCGCLFNCSGMRLLMCERHKVNDGYLRVSGAIQIQI